MSLLANKEWSAFETLYEPFIPVDSTTLEAYILGDSIFVRFGSTL